MEEIKSYIESGVLELYAMGDLNQDERRDVESMAAKYPEVKRELEQIQNALEGYAEVYSVTPVEGMRDRVINKLLQTKNEENTIETEPVVAEEANVVAMNSSGSFYKYAFAASIALLVLSVSALFVLYNQLENSKQQLAVLQQNNQTITSRANYINQQLAVSQEALSVFHNPEVKLVKLAGQKIA
ncbi:MAG: hypothetical protein JWQ25_1221, partial [Daejeonella sp.]|nr:hypothetical protein [Daejeonella sp.]